MQSKEIIVEDIKLLATIKSVKRYMKDGCNYSLYCDCYNCKNANWYDDDYCNNQCLHFIDTGKALRVYCEKYEDK